jgi:glycosyltransferase involved in cell wall biosynthesis
MKICILTPTFLPKIGGTEIALDRLALHLNQSHHQVGVLAQTPRHFHKHCDSFAYPVRRYPRPWTLRGHFFGIQRALTLWHREMGFDVISAHTAYPAGYAACLWAHKHRIPVVITCRGGDISADSRFRRRRMIVQRLAWSLNAADAVTVLSENMIPAVQELAPSCQPRVIYNGVDESLAEPVDPPTNESWYSWLNGQPFLLAMGRLHPVKGFDLLIQAYAKMKDRFDPASRLVIAGAGSEEKRLRKLIERLELGRHILLPGQVAGSAKAWLLQNSRAFVLSSHREGFPMVLLEAMICGRPVLATRCVDRIALVADQKASMLVDPGQIEGLAAGLQAINNRPDLPVLGQCAHERARHYLWTAVAEKYIEVFASAIESRNR